MESNDNIKIILKDNDNLKFKLDNKIEKVSPPLENLEVNPSKEEQSFKSQDYYGYDNVTINPVTNSIDENIKSENIKKDIPILGVTGNIEELNATEISVNPTSEEQVITPEEPYNGFSKVTIGAQSGINPAEYFETTITSSNYNYFIDKYLLKKIPTITIESNVTSLENSFSGTQVSELKIVGDTSNVTNMNNTFNSCSKLTTIPQLDTTSATNMIGMFAYCYELTTIPQLDTSNVKSMDSMFAYCNRLTTIPQLDASNVKNIYNFVNNNRALQNFGGLKNLGQGYLTSQNANYYGYTLNLSTSTNLTYDSLMNAINGLYDIASAGVQPQKIQLGSTNLAKLTEEEIAIAQNKGWNVS